MEQRDSKTPQGGRGADLWPAHRPTGARDSGPVVAPVGAAGQTSSSSSSCGAAMPSSSSSSSSANPRLPCPSTLLCNMPDGVRAVVLDERAARIAAVKRDLPLAIASGRRDAVDRVIGPVRRLVRAKVAIDHDDRVALISIAYPAIFSAGVPVNELLADLCSDLVRIVPRLRPDAIELDWVPLLESIWNLCDEVEEVNQTRSCSARVP